MQSKQLRFRIHTLQTLMDAELYDFATGFFDETRVKVCASGSRLRLIQATALMARGVAERGGMCLVVLSSLEGKAPLYLRGLFKQFDLPQADWEYKTAKTTPPPVTVVLTTQKTLRKVLLKKGRVRLPFDTLIFLGIEITLTNADWFDSNLILIRLWEMGVMHRISLYFLMGQYITDIVGWLEAFEQEVVTIIDDANPIPQEVMKLEPEEVEQFFQMPFRAGKHNFVFRLTRKWRSKKTFLRAIRQSFPYFLVAGEKRAWFEREALRMLRFGLALGLIYRRKYPYRYEPKKEAKKSGNLVAPMIGRVTKVSVKGGEFVNQGQELLLVETNTKELRFRAPFGGRVTRVHSPELGQVRPGTLLLELEPWQSSGLYHCIPKCSYLATLDVDFAVTEALWAWLVAERAHRGMIWVPAQKELEQKLGEFAEQVIRESHEPPPKEETQQEASPTEVSFLPPSNPALAVFFQKGGSLRPMEAVQLVIRRAEGFVDEVQVKQVLEVMDEVIRGVKTKDTRKPLPKQDQKTSHLQLLKETETKSKTPIQIMAYVTSRLAGKATSRTQDWLSKEELGGRLRSHYGTFAKELNIPAHRVYYALRKYIREGHDEEVFTERDKKCVEYEQRDNLITMIKRLTWGEHRFGRGRPWRVLLYPGVEQQEANSFLLEARCKACTFFVPQERACQLWFTAAREGVTQRATAKRAIRGGVFPELSACSRFFPEEGYKVPEGLVRVGYIAQNGDLVRVPHCRRCGEPLAHWPSVARTVECPQCGTAYRKKYTGELQEAENKWDILERELRILCGHEPPRRRPELQSLSVYVSPKNSWEMTRDQLRVEYLGVTETYALTEVGHVTCHDRQLAKELEARDIRVTWKPLSPAIQLPLDPDLAAGMRRERKEQLLLPCFVLALVFSARFHTERVRETLKRVPKAVAEPFERELEEILAYQEFEILRCLWGGEATPGYLRGLEGRMHRDVEALLRALLTRVLKDERVVYPGAGRRWGKHAEATVDIVLRVAAAKTMFDSARNYVNRQIRSHLRELSAEEGFGWNSEALFLHQAADKPGRSVHLDLEELARMEARLEVVVAFLQGELIPEDFAESYHLGIFPRYAPKPSTTPKLQAIARRVLERPYFYGGRRCTLWEAYVEHVRNLKQALLSEGEVEYIPLMWVRDFSEVQWIAFR